MPDKPKGKHDKSDGGLQDRIEPAILEISQGSVSRAVGVTPNGTVPADDGHGVLVYDERNPAFQAGGAGIAAYAEAQLALQRPTMLRKCSWQRIPQHTRDKGILPWLTEQLESKYGL
jgi:hypothetical protein